MGKVNTGYPPAIILGALPAGASLTASSAVMQPKKLLVGAHATGILTASSAALGKSTSGIPTLTYMSTFEATASLTVSGHIVQPLRTPGSLVSASTTTSTLGRKRGMTAEVSNVQLSTTSVYPTLSSSGYSLTIPASVSLTASDVMLWKQVFRRVRVARGRTVPAVEEEELVP
jgi:hypothetical protein